MGGITFDSYADADDFCLDAMYAPDVKGLIPAAQGTFSDEKIDGLRIYIPQK